MSVSFVPPNKRGNPPPSQATIQKMLDENNQLINSIVEHQQHGRAQEAMQYQQLLHRNLIYLATIADSNQNNFENMLQGGGGSTSGSSTVATPTPASAPNGPSRSATFNGTGPPQAQAGTAPSGGLPSQGYGQQFPAGTPQYPNNQQPGYTGSSAYGAGGQQFATNAQQFVQNASSTAQAQGYPTGNQPQQSGFTASNQQQANFGAANPPQQSAASQPGYNVGQPYASNQYGSGQGNAPYSGGQPVLGQQYSSQSQMMSQPAPTTPQSGGSAVSVASSAQPPHSLPPQQQPQGYTQYGGQQPASFSGAQPSPYYPGAGQAPTQQQGFSAPPGGAPSYSSSQPMYAAQQFPAGAPPQGSLPQQQGAPAQQPSQAESGYQQQQF